MTKVFVGDRPEREGRLCRSKATQHIHPYALLPDLCPKVRLSACARTTGHKTVDESLIRILINYPVRPSESEDVLIADTSRSALQQREHNRLGKVGRELC